MNLTQYKKYGYYECRVDRKTSIHLCIRRMFLLLNSMPTSHVRLNFSLKQNRVFFSTQKEQNRNRIRFIYF